MMRLMYRAVPVFALLMLMSAPIFGRGRGPHLWSDTYKETETPTVIGTWVNDQQKTWFAFAADGTLTRNIHAKDGQPPIRWRQATDGKIFILNPGGKHYVYIGFVKDDVFYTDHDCYHIKYTKAENKDK